MSTLKTIHIKGEATLTFDGEEAVTIEQEAPQDMHAGLKAFLDEMFTKENMTPEEQKAILAMTVGEFCALCDVSAGQPLEEPKLTRGEFIKNLTKIPCGICHSTNALTLVDGVITCVVCGVTLGDIDDYPTR